MGDIDRSGVPERAGPADQKWHDIFPLGSPVMLKMVFLPVAPLKAWRLEMSSNPLHMFSMMRMVLRLSMWE